MVLYVAMHTPMLCSLFRVGLLADDLDLHGLMQMPSGGRCPGRAESIKRQTCLKLSQVCRLQEEK
jgi:hypothetical protein